MPAIRYNPFEFGGELKAASLVDREQELDLVIRAIENGGKLFLIGPRRYGKTSILAAAEEQLDDSGVAVLRYDAEVYESLARIHWALGDRNMARHHAAMSIGLRDEWDFLEPRNLSVDTEELVATFSDKIMAG